MTIATTTQAAVPAGWYPDPAGSTDLRWWDGAAWTAHTTSPVPVTPATSAPGSEPVLTLADLIAGPVDGGAPADPGSGITAYELGEPVTRWAWYLAFYPYVYGLTASLVAGVPFALTFSDPTAPDQLFMVIAIIAGFIPGWIFAALDRRTLASRGYEVLPSLLWMLLLPPYAYLLRRRRAMHLELQQTKALDIVALVVGIIGSVPALVLGGFLVIMTAGTLMTFGPGSMIPGGGLPVVDPSTPISMDHPAGHVELTAADLPGEVAVAISNYVGPPADCSEQAARILPGATFVCELTYPDGTAGPVWTRLDTDGSVYATINPPA